MRISGPVLGTSDPIGLAEFYERFLGWPIVEREGEGPGEEPWAKVRSEELGLKIEFQYEPHFTPPVWPPVPGEQQMLIHLDIGVPDLDGRRGVRGSRPGRPRPSTSRRTTSG